MKRYIILAILLISSNSFADNPSFRRHVYWRKDGYCKVREWFVSENGSVMDNKNDPDNYMYRPKITINQDPFCREISKADKYLMEE